MNDAMKARAPWHLWAVGVAGLLWNSFGCYDYAMTNLRNPAYLAQLPPEMIAYLDALPAWLTGFWALGVWGSLAGSILLLARSRYAVAAFALSLLGLAITQGYQMTVAMPGFARSDAMIAMQVVIAVVLVLQLWYAVRLRGAGVLR
ncbi:hypothetical protein RXV95_14425 [Novosphingobium sp. ZN18A2]|uniref:hypothetical protein n=1 Tax=Novosphingobium sp. ZN18A2 TaxID=3079861 RepID=UPI0030CF4261